MLLTDARRPARTGPDGALIPLAEQDRTRWSADSIAEGVALITHTLANARLGPYQLQAAIAAVHDEAATRRRTPTGRRSSRSTKCSSASRPIPWSRSTGPSRSRWCTGRRPASTCWRRWTTTRDWRSTIASRRCGPTSWRWQATGRPHATLPGRRPSHHQPPRTALPRGGRPAGRPVMLSPDRGASLPSFPVSRRRSLRALAGAPGSPARSPRGSDAPAGSRRCVLPPGRSSRTPPPWTHRSRGRARR